MADFDQVSFGNLCQALADQSKEGIDCNAKKVFDDIDKNGDGILQKEEIFAFAGCISGDAEKTTAEMMKDLDFNQDGQIEIDEWTKFWYIKAGLDTN